MFATPSGATTGDLAELDQSRPIHFVGIGGCSMSGLALMLHHQGYTVTGSDRVSGPNTKTIADAGITVTIGHQADNVPAATQLVVVTSAAVEPTNPELVRARETDVPVMDRAVLLGGMADAAEQRIAIAGTSGKTTTTSLVGRMLLACELDPTVAVGTRAGDFTDGGNFRLGDGPFVTEACEYHEAFRFLEPDAAVVLNISHDHGDFFTDGIRAIEEAFARFVARTRPGGLVVVGADCPRARLLEVPAAVRRVSVGFAADADYRIGDVVWKAGRATFTIGGPGRRRVRLEPALPGRHNILNVAAAFALASELDLPLEKVGPALNQFTGAPRRLEYQGNADGIAVWDDLACSTGEATATMEAVRGLAQGGRITVVLRPNSFSRVRDNFAEYAGVFTTTEHVIVTDIFPGRDTETFGQHARDLVANMAAKGRDVVYVPDRDGRPDRERIFDLLTARLESGDILVTLGPVDLAGLAAEYRQRRASRWWNEEDFAA
ncbi:UDP-N-acetylmuramate--L-alanine ligase [Streptomyces sp. SID11385]|uniref:UDP-N-acetylmuramate--L-alanine ligase n=1 Tax=Streptomyces sp. SID11385 TaxID=2706031 RepID=UPI0013C60CA6|nr:UDP-N-acetylmuramate--L-alanine ligase [Streptomyces sp. SID11385]NEA43378.1 UDP-N-acetylmuramate--L-alanine ligase [Streptomyces sp. SID11385]